MDDLPAGGSVFMGDGEARRALRWLDHAEAFEKRTRERGFARAQRPLEKHPITGIQYRRKRARGFDELRFSAAWRGLPRGPWGSAWL